MKKIVYNIGKSKIIYKSEKKDLLIMKFLNSIHGGGRKGKIVGTGKIRADISEIFFNRLEKSKIKTHFRERLSDTEFLVERLEMFKLEIVPRNIAAGSLVKNYPYKLGDELDPPLINFYLKLEPDPLLTDEMMLSLHLITKGELVKLKLLAQKVNNILTNFLYSKKIILVDFKFEAGKNNSGEIIIGDEISCDSARLWDRQSLKSLDKDVFRYKLGDVLGSYKMLSKRILF